MQKKYIILTSTMGLGTYVPALQLRDYLNENGIECDVDLFESHFSDSLMSSYLKNKEAYHKSMKVAVVGHIMASKRLKSALDDQSKNEILRSWEEAESFNFIIISGNWIELINEYIQLYPEKVRAYIFHMDIGIAPSWKNFKNDANMYKEIFPFDKSGIHFIMENKTDKLSTTNLFPDKTFRVFVHGGGWGMGNYQEIVRSLKAKDDISVISAAYKDSEAEDIGDYCIIDSEWKPWIKDETDQYQYPVMKIKRGCDSPIIIDNQYSNGLYGIYSECSAIISKPGGATLMDSLITGVPIVFIEPIAEHEKINAAIWEELGLGISFDKWEKSGFDKTVVYNLRENLKKATYHAQGVGEYLKGLIKGDN